MRIRYTRSGGIANISISIEIDLQKLPREIVNQIRGLLKLSDAFHLKGRPKAHPRIPDDLHHELEIGKGEKCRRISCNDSECPPHLLEIFDRLYAEAIKKNKRN